MGQAIGIDFGLHNCQMAMFEGKRPITLENIDGNRLTPAVVGLSRDGERLVGEQARAQAALRPEDTILEIRRFMGRNFRDPDVQRDIQMVPYKVTEADNGEVQVWLGGKAYSPPEISAFILEAMKQEAEEQIGEVTHAVITAPAHFGQRQREAFRAAGRLAGFEVMGVISEPVAAALAYGINASYKETKTILVYDLGGSTFDATVLFATDGDFSEVAFTGDSHLGGNDFDQAIIDHLIAHGRDRYDVDLRDSREALHKLRAAAERAKKSLSKRRKVGIAIASIAKSRGRFVDIDLYLTRAEYEDLIRPYVQKTIDLVHQAIREADCRPTDIDHILLAGGATLTPLTVNSLRREFGKEKIVRGVNPTECVAQGAAVQTGILHSEGDKVTTPSKWKTKAKRRKGAAKRHDPIPAPIAQMMVTCFVNAGRLTEAERLLRDLGLTQEGGSLRYELGLAYAEQGKLDEALGQFKTLLKQQPDETKARQAALDVLRALASQRAAQEDWVAAEQALKEALTLSPGDEQLQRYLSGVQEALPALYLAQNKRDKAAELWEGAQSAEPTNYRVTHQLAILYHRWAIEAEQKGHTRIADRVWPKALANWVLLAESNAFWADWPAEREAVYGMSIEPGDIDALRRTGLLERLERVQRNFETSYIQAGDKRNANRHKEYRFLLKLEVKTARALKETADLLRQRGRMVEVPVCAGPVLLAQLGLLESARKLAGSAQRLDPENKAAKELGVYLSPLGQLQLLVKERQLERALPELKKILKKEPANTEARRLLVRALKETGQGLAQSDVKKAIAAWAEGLGYDPANAELKDLIGQTCVKKATELLQANNFDEAIDLLNLGLRHAPDHRGLKENLAASLNRRGVQYANRQQWDRAIADLEQALNYQPRNGQFKKNLASAYNAKGATLANEAIELARAGQMVEADHQLEEAIALLEQAVQQAPREASFQQNLANARGARQLARPTPARKQAKSRRSEAAVAKIMLQMLQSNPNDPRARRSLAETCNTEGANLANEAVELANFNRAEACGMLNDAEAIFGLGLQYNANDRVLKDNLAKVHLLKRQLRC